MDRRSEPHIQTGWEPPVRHTLLPFALTLCASAAFGTASAATPSIADSTLPFVTAIEVGSPHGGPVICMDDSIVVRAYGVFPNPCFRVRIETLDDSASPLPRPPIVRFVVERDCLRLNCPRVSSPWNARVVLPPLPPGRYDLIAQLALAQTWSRTLVLLGR